MGKIPLMPYQYSKSKHKSNDMNVHWLSGYGTFSSPENYLDNERTV